MTQWNSLSQIVTDLRLDADPTDREAVRSALRTAMAAIHPDQHGGEFSTQADEERFHELNDALHACDRLGLTALVPIQDIPGFVAAIRDAIALPPQDSPAQQHADYSQAVQAEIRRRLILPRIGSGVFAAVCGALLAFGKNFEGDPLLGPLATSDGGRVTVLVALLWAGILFVVTRWREQSQAAQAEWLSTASGRQLILARVFDQRQLHGGASPVSLSFSVSDFVTAIRGSIAPPLALRPLSAHLSVSSAEKLAQMHIDELERQGVVRKFGTKQIDPRYDIDIQTVNDLLHRREPPAA